MNQPPSSEGPAAPAAGASAATRWIRDGAWTLGLIALAGTVRWLMDPWLADRVPFATFFIAIVVALRYVGSGSAVAVMLAGLAWAMAMWFPEDMRAHGVIAAAFVYVISSLAIVYLGRDMHRAKSLADKRLRDLEDSLHVLRASQSRLQLATEVSGIGVFEWDMSRDSFTGENPEAYRIFGREPGMPKLAMSAFISRHLHPDDAARVQAALQAAMRPGERFHVVFRNRRGESDWRWVEVAGRFFFDAEGAPTHLLGVIADINDRKELEQSLRKMAADLSTADVRKDEFLATLAHELRNPLAPIRSGIEVFRRSPGLPGHLGQVVDVMERQMSHLVRLVDDLIDVSRITRDRLALRREPVTLQRVLQSAADACRPAVEAKAQRFELQVPAAPLQLDADPTRLVQVFSNLINNASKYTHREGSIRVAVEDRGQAVAVVVEDDGVGIPRDQQHRLFEMFTQLDRSLERTQGGLGIGLAMVRRLVELHGGQVRVDSEGEGRGTRATVLLPLAPEPRAPSPSDLPAPTSAPARRIAVVDDNADAAASLAQLLSLMGHEVVTGADGVEAIELARSFRPDVLLLDLGMPRLNGYDACRRIRELPGGSELVIIAVTGWGQDADRLRSAAAGFDHHLTKPVDPKALETLLAGIGPALPVT